MSESSLSVSYTDLVAAVGRFMGYGRTSSAYSTDQLADIEDVIASGLRQFYFPPPISQGDTGHRWSFLKPATTLATVIDQTTYTMPDDFGGIEGKVTFTTTADGPQEVVIVGEGAIRKYLTSTDTGQPKYIAIRPKSTDGTAGQRFEALIAPTPDAIYTLSYRKVVLQNKLSAVNLYPLGGMAHGETIMQSCLAIAEQRYDDNDGPQYKRFLERLAASIVHDRDISTPDYFGYNGDGVSYTDAYRTTGVTVNGQEVE